jgi:hypothetical protein
MLTPKIFQALTIIAAAGKDSDFRLPRVGSTHRPEQPWLEVGKRVLVSSLVNPRVEMESSKWPIRGRTYQEGLLSRRRLVFTRSQVYFQCAGMHCFESVELPLKAFHTSDGQFRDSIVKCRIFFLMAILRDTWKGYAKRISEYSARHLSFEADVLNIIWGVLKLFETPHHHLHHLWGLPILIGSSYKRSENPEFDCKQLALSLLWETNRPARRRKGFSSWSWVGWNSFGGYKLPYRTHPLSGIFNVKLTVELKNGTLVPRTFDEVGVPLQYRTSEPMSNYLHIYAWTTKIRLRLPQDGASWRLVKPLPFNMPSSKSTFNITMDFTDNTKIGEKAEEKLWDGIVLSYSQWRYWLGARNCEMLVVGDEGDHSYRSGVMTLYLRDLEAPSEKALSENLGSEFFGETRFERRWFKLG